MPGTREHACEASQTSTWISVSRIWYNNMCMVLMRRILRAIIESRITIHATSSAPTKSIEHTNAQVQMHNPFTSRARVQLTKWPQSHCTQTEGRWDNPSGPWRRASPVWRRSREKASQTILHLACNAKEMDHIEQGFSLAVTTSISFPVILARARSRGPGPGAQGPLELIKKGPYTLFMWSYTILCWNYTIFVTLIFFHKKRSTFW